MINFIRKLFSLKKDRRTVVILNNDGSEEYKSHEFKPKKLWLLSGGVLVGIIIFVIFLMMFTPLGDLVYNQKGLRQSVIKMQKQVAMLQDSMKARNMQLHNLRMALFSGKDSAFPKVKMDAGGSTVMDERAQDTTSSTLINSFELPDQGTIISARLDMPAQFPAPWPVDGTLTRKFSIKSGHYGIDIAGNKGETFYAIANGVVVGVSRNLNYGNVLYIQHSNGILTVYKHASELAVKLGDIITPGDVLGRVGNTGILSSGPHLHMEMWANGIPQDPLHYLVNL